MNWSSYLTHKLLIQDVHSSVFSFWEYYKSILSKMMSCWKQVYGLVKQLTQSSIWFTGKLYMKVVTRIVQLSFRVVFISLSQLYNSHLTAVVADFGTSSSLNLFHIMQAVTWLYEYYISAYQLYNKRQ